jgi:hypothetical protein
MRFHTAPVVKGGAANQLGFAIRNNELSLPQKMFTQGEYPSLPYDMVKVTSRDGRNIYLPASKFKEISSADF